MIIYATKQFYSRKIELNKLIQNKELKTASTLEALLDLFYVNHMKCFNFLLISGLQKVLTVDYHRIKTFKIKTYKTQQSVSRVNGIIRVNQNNLL